MLAVYFSLMLDGPYSIASIASQNGLCDKILILVSGSLKAAAYPFPGSSPFRVLKTSPTLSPNTFIPNLSSEFLDASQIASIASDIGLYERIFVVVTGSIKTTGFPLPGSSPLIVLCKS